MKLYHINTDSNIRAKNEKPTYEDWFDQGMAFAGDKEIKWKHAVFKRLRKDDVLFAYHNKAGYVLAGIVDEPWDGKTYEGNKRLLYEEKYEYRIKVNWVRDWRNSPKKDVELLGIQISKTPKFSVVMMPIDPAEYPGILLYAPTIQSLQEYTASLERAVAKSEADSDEERLRRLEMAPKKPDLIPVTTTVFKRNPDVIAEVLKRANGVCEGCNNVAPFPRKIDGSPYLEVHHIVMLSDGGDDTVQNAQALCPNCHRKAHYG